MRALWAFLAAAAWIGWLAPAAAQGAGGQQRFTIDANALLEVSQPALGGETNPVRLRVELHLAVSGGAVSGSITRSVMSKDNTYQRVVQADHTPFQGQLGRPGETKSVPGYAVAILSGNTLTILQALKTGAIRITIRMASGCGMRIDHAREVGKGNTQSRGVDGQGIEISGWRQVSSTCRFTRG